MRTCSIGSRGLAAAAVTAPARHGRAPEREEGTMAVKRALVMSGGGAKGAFELGAAYGLIVDRGLDFDVIAGVSAGALHAAMLAQGKGHAGLLAQVEHLWDIWQHINGPEDLFVPRVRGGKASTLLSAACSLIFTNSVYDPTPVRTRLLKEVDDLKLKGSGKQFRVDVVSLESGEVTAVNQETYSEFAEWTLASGSIPWVFPPVARKAESFVDGGVRNITPFKSAFEALRKIKNGADLEMYVVLASPVGRMPEKAGTQLRNGLEIGERAIAILENTVYREDVLHALDVSDSVRAWTDLKASLAPPYPPALDEFPFQPPKYELVEMYGIVPDEWYMDTLDFNHDLILKAFGAGRAKANANWVLTGKNLRAALA
jgi:NTE family protein